MNETVRIVFGLLGGLAIFLYGMNLMSDSLQKVAGEKMRTILGLLTKNPFLGVLSGALVTAVLQSSSATTVMAIGFVSAGLMKLPQAISIIFGANIGTTITAQLIAFKLSDYIYIIIFVGFALYFFTKREKIKFVGATIFGFGLLFDGIEIMGSVMKPLASSPVFSNLIEQVTNVPVLGILVGAGMTLVVQSSSATIAVLQNVASTAGPDGVHSVIGLAGALPVLIGDNIGTTITAVLASIGQSINAKRTAAAHCIFNISGAFIFIWILHPYAKLIQWISPHGPEVEVISRQIANAHTLFNITMTLIWTPLIFLMVKIVMKLMPAKDGETAIPMSMPRYLDKKMLRQPVAAIELASNETARVTGLIRDMLKKLAECKPKEMREVCGEISYTSAQVITLNNQIQDYLSALLSAGNVAEKQADRVTGMVFIIDALTRVSDHLGMVSKNIYEVQGDKDKYSKIAIGNIHDFAEKLVTIYTACIEALTGDQAVDLMAIERQRADIFDFKDDMFKAHIKRVHKGKCEAQLTASFGELLQNLDYIGSCCIDLADLVEEQHTIKMDLKNDAKPEPAPAV
ncbi:MAG: Na/Pi cotransporter family protein [Peptococcaceae bacterium]|nr:Na/Pi cotransporter family protein [Peptococcaceae bacterium]